MKTLKLFTLLFFTISLVGCDLFGEAEEVVTANTCDAMYKAAREYSDAVTTWSSNQTRSNCLRIKTKGNAFISAARNCSYADQAQVTQTKNYINQIDCN